MDTTNKLYQKLWSASDNLRSQMDANKYKRKLLANKDGARDELDIFLEILGDSND